MLHTDGAQALHKSTGPLLTRGPVPGAEPIPWPPPMLRREIY